MVTGLDGAEVLPGVGRRESRQLKSFVNRTDRTVKEKANVIQEDEKQLLVPADAADTDPGSSHGIGDLQITAVGGLSNPSVTHAIPSSYPTLRGQSIPSG
jgi:hypothetical protein